MATYKEIKGVTLQTKDEDPSLFVGSWIGRDSVRHSIPKILIFFSLVITYFSGPVGLVIHGVVRSLFAKKLSFDE